MATDTVTLTIDDGEETDELTVPSELVDILRESPDETDPQVVGDIAMFGMTQRITALSTTRRASRTSRSSRSKRKPANCSKSASASPSPS